MPSLCPKPQLVNSLTTARRPDAQDNSQSAALSSETLEGPRISVSSWMWRTSRSREPSRRCERLEALKERHEKGLLTSVEFLKKLLNLARDVVSADARRRERGNLHLGLLA